MPHPLEHSPAALPLTEAEAQELATSMRAFGAASRLQLLWALLDGEATVEDLMASTEMTQSLVSHQLRVLRDLRFVTVRREGRRAFYRLHDHHVPELLAAIRHHHEHVRPTADLALPSEATGEPAAST
jgi:DNA-binding transcriptional ArsR family regulator